ncbi:MAG TPA: exonuclease domain-containing protein [bacterium]
MAGRSRLPNLVAGGTVLCLALFAAADLLLLTVADGAAARTQTHRAVGAAAALALLAIAALAVALQRFVFRPLEELGREVRIARVNPAHALELPARHLLGDVPAAIQDLAAEAAHSQRTIADAVAASSRDLEDHRSRLEAVLMALEEGILVCDEQARVVFYNPAARLVFHDNPALGVGRSLHLLIAAAPVENSLGVLRRQRARSQAPEEAGGDVSFVCTTLQGGVLSCRIRLLPSLPGVSWSFLLACKDISVEAEAQGRRESLLRATVKEMRVPLTGLGLSADSLELLPSLDVESRTALEQSIRHDAHRLIAQFDVLAREIEEVGSPRYVTREIFVEDIVASVAQRLEARGLRLTMIGEPLWVRADVHALLFLLEFLAERIRAACGVAALEVETLLGDRHVYFTYCWHGAPVPQGEIQRWMSEAAEPYDAHTVGELLERQGSEVWSRAHQTPGYATLSFPLPSAPSRWGPPPPALPARPVYVEIAAHPAHVEAGGREGVPLGLLTFVVFDTETTGLAPGGGDRIVSLAGVKIVNRGIVVGEAFDRLVNPGRDIPPASVRFHGITDDMVREKPRLPETLRAFHAFVGDAVLVGHNAAFDMRFIGLEEPAAGVHFGGPLLDTLALSRFLHDHTPVHSLDAVARRLGVAVRDRHTALGDALITAEVFLRLLYLLQERGVTTLGQALEVSGR